MRLKQALKKLRDNYVIGQVQRLTLPPFPEEPPHRYRVRFSGRVQKVGFRLEVCELAQRLSLTGFCQNLENGDVLAEFQGGETRIFFLLSFMESLKRIKVREKVMTPLELQPNETGFIRR